MTSEELKALQQPLKDAFRQDPTAAQHTLQASVKLDQKSLSCALPARVSQSVAGLHPATGGDGTLACSAEMLLQSLAACAGVTLCAVATAMGVSLKGGEVEAEGDLDFRGTLGVEKGVPVGLTAIRLHFRLLTDDASPDQLSTLARLTERYCVVFQTLKQPPVVTIDLQQDQTTTPPA